MAKGKAKFFVQLGDKATGAMPGVELREMALAGNVTPQTNVALSKGSGAELQGVSAKRVNGLFDESDQPLPHPAEAAKETAPPAAERSIRTWASLNRPKIDQLSVIELGIERLADPIDLRGNRSGGRARFHPRSAHRG